MRIFTLILSALLLTLASTQASAAKQEFTCVIRTGYSTAVGTGESEPEAKANAREACGNAIIDKYFALRGDIPDSEIGPITDTCINLECEQ